MHTEMSKAMTLSRNFHVLRDHHDRPERAGRRFRPERAVEKLNKLIARIDPEQLASRFLNGLMGPFKGQRDGDGARAELAAEIDGGKIRANDIKVTGFQVVSDVQSQPQADSLPGFALGTSKLELSFQLSGRAYQSLIQGMLAKANVDPSTLDPIVTAIDAKQSFDVQLGLTSAFLLDQNRNFDFAWQGAMQVFDSVSGQGSMGYGWSASGTATSADAQTLARLVPFILYTATTGKLPAASPTFFPTTPFFTQPAVSTTPSPGTIPQQQVASLYVQNVIGKTPEIGWPPSGVPVNTAFDPIPTNPTFTPAVF